VEMKDCLQFEKKRETEVEGGDFLRNRKDICLRRGFCLSWGEVRSQVHHHTVKAGAEEPPRVH